MTLLRLLRDRVIVRRISMPTQTKGGIYLPLKAVELPQLAHVVHIGPKNPDNIQVGNLVLLRKFEGRPLFFNDETLYEMFIEDLLAIIED